MEHIEAQPRAHRRGAAKSTGRQQAGRQQGRTAGRRTTWTGSGTSDGQRGQAAGMERHPTKWTCSRTAGTSSRTAETDSTDTDNRHRHQSSVDRQRGWAEGTGSRTAGTSSRTARRTAQTQTNTVQGVARRRWRPSDNRHRPDTYIDGHGQQAQPTCWCTFSKLDLQTPSPHDDQESAMHDA